MFVLEIHGDAQARALVSGLLRDVQREDLDRMREASSTIAREVRSNLSSLWDRQTGTLARGVRFKVRRSAGFEVEGTVHATPRAWYWRLLEHGTKYITGRQAVALAVDTTRDAVEQILAAPIRRVVGA